MEKVKIIFLYTELANYFLANCKALAKENCEVHIIRWPVNKEAPFNFDLGSDLKIYDRNNFDKEKLIQFIENINPDVLICLGWIDKDYLKASIKSKVKGKKIIVLDNHWSGNLKQRLGSIYSKFNIVRFFDGAWVPGEKQKHFAIKMGFKSNQIQLGYYCADTDFFNSVGEARISLIKNNVPKRFIYIGRYYDFKGIEDLWSAFIDVSNENSENNWELYCLGTGDLTPVDHKKIKHFGFVQPNDLTDFLNMTSVFIIPSRVEPWAVVVHEMALCGMPIIASDVVAAADVFVRENENGFRFKAGNVEELKLLLKRVIAMTDEDIRTLSLNSVKMGNTYLSKNWIEKIKSFAI